MNSQNLIPYKLYGTLMWFLTALFAFRVSAQLLILNFPDLPLPAFERWHSEVLSYPILVVFQLAILLVLGFLSHRMIGNRVSRNKKIGKRLLIIGIVYFIIMLLRLSLSLSIIYLPGVSDLAWFQRPLPSFFHLVLASFILILARCYLTGEKHV
ncbi:MAG: hypothetical protein V7785_09985 [Bermanella sp.]